MTWINNSQNKLRILIYITPKNFGTPLNLAGFQAY